MNLTDQLNIRVDHDLKKEAEDILNKLGIKTGDAIRILLKQVCMTQSFPLELKIPNSKTINAMKELEKGGGTKVSLNEFNDMLDSL